MNTIPSTSPAMLRTYLDSVAATVPPRKPRRHRFGHSGTLALVLCAVAVVVFAL